MPYKKVKSAWLSTLALCLLAHNTIASRSSLPTKSHFGKTSGDIKGEIPDLVKVLQLNSIDNTIILTQASCPFLDVAENWIIHATKAGIKNWITIAEDEPSLLYLNATYSDHVVPASWFSHRALKNTSTYMAYNTDEFDKMMCDRLIYQRAVLHLGFIMVWVDMDTVFFQDPLKLFPDGYDVVGVDDQWPILSDAHDSKHICGCLLKWAPTQKALAFHNRFMEKCHEVPGHDQVALNIVFQSELRKKITYYIMPWQLFPNGKIIDVFDWKPPNDQQKPDAIMPVWLHANWREGSYEKQAFFKKYRAWDIDSQKIFPTCVK
jgi:rhamnogalacturonan II specific xylosyltransferase